MISGENLIGSMTSAKGTIKYKTFNPVANTPTAYTFTEATQEEVRQAVALSEEAFRRYSLTSGIERSRFLKAIAAELETLGDVLLELYQEETGLPYERAVAERSRTLFQLNLYANLVATDDWRNTIEAAAIPYRDPKPKPSLIKEYRPLGPVVVFGASNFPLAYSTAGGDVASALASGCTVIVKSHTLHAATSELVAKAIIRASEKTKMPKGVFSHLNAQGYEVGAMLVQHPTVKAVGFTGSEKGGRALINLANSRKIPIPIFAEMGSVNPTIFSESALSSKGEHLSKMYASTITMGAGQFCTHPGLLFVPTGQTGDLFVKKLREELAQFPAQCMLHPSIKSNYENSKKKILVHKEVVLLTPIASNKTPNFSVGELATTQASYFIHYGELHQEVFGPFSLVVRYDSLTDLEHCIRVLNGQLTGSLHLEVEDVKLFKPLLYELQNRVGRLVFNGISNGVEVCKAMMHGGPYPASSDARFSAVGEDSIYRWVRPVTYQDLPEYVQV